MELKVFNTQRFSIYDGPGIRTTLYLKGCSLECFWCHNPEGISPTRQIQFYKDKCIGCQSCKSVCPVNNMNDLKILNNFHHIDKECETCQRCVDECPAKALEIVGTNYETKELYELLMRDHEFYLYSGGGVTFSGGEPLLQSKALKELMAMLKMQNINCIVETAGNVSWQAFEDVLPYTDTFYFDIKAISPELHRKGTGSDNFNILQNFNLLVNNNSKIAVRIPIIPGLNTSENEIMIIIEFLKEYPQLEFIELMPYHNIGVSKYATLKMDCRCKEITCMSNIEVESIKNIFRGNGLKIK